MCRWKKWYLWKRFCLISFSRSAITKSLLLSSQYTEVVQMVLPFLPITVQHTRKYTTFLIEFTLIKDTGYLIALLELKGVQFDQKSLGKRRWEKDSTNSFGNLRLHTCSFSLYPYPFLYLLYLLYLCVCMLSHFSHVWLFATLWTIALQTPLSMGFSRQEYWNGCHALLQGLFLTKGKYLWFLCSLHWQADSLPIAPPGSLPIPKFISLSL